MLEEGEEEVEEEVGRGEEGLMVDIQAVTGGRRSRGNELMRKRDERGREGVGLLSNTHDLAKFPWRDGKSKAHCEETQKHTVRISKAHCEDPPPPLSPQKRRRHEHEHTCTRAD